jgi:hypothetical protein
LREPAKPHLDPNLHFFRWIRFLQIPSIAKN